MIKLLLYEIREYWPKWAKVLLFLVGACLLLVAVVSLGWKIYDVHMEKYTDFSRTYQGVRWTYWDLEPSEPITVIVEGEKNGYGAFSGTIVIRGAGFEYTFADCRVQILSDGTAYLRSSEVDRRDDPAAYLECAYAWMMLDREWETIAFYKLSPEETWSETEMEFVADDVYTAPAEDLEEAVALTKALAQKVDSFKDLTWDKQDTIND